ELLAAIEKQPSPTCPFNNHRTAWARAARVEGITAEDMKTLRWVKPTVVVEVASWSRRGTGYCGTRAFSACAATSPLARFVAKRLRHAKPARRRCRVSGPTASRDGSRPPPHRRAASEDGDQAARPSDRRVRPVPANNPPAYVSAWDRRS